MTSQVMVVLTAVPRIFGLDQQTLIAMGINALNIGVLAFFLAKNLYQPVRNFMRKRSEGIKLQLESAEKDMVKANELKLEYEQKIKEIETERTDILDDARKLAAETSRRLLVEAKKESDAIKERAKANVDLEWEHAQIEMKQAIIEVAAIMSEKILKRVIDKGIQKELFADAMVELEDKVWRS